MGMKRFIQILSIGGVLVILMATRTAAQNLDTASPIEFFNKVADRMLRQSTTEWIANDFNNYTNTFGVTEPFSLTASAGKTNIPVFVNGQFVYSPAVNRLLQLAANIYDATTTNFFPSVFRPLFSTDAAGNLFITSYTNVTSVTGIADLQLSTPFDARTIAAIPNLVNVPDNIYGVPWIIGVKKGFPNFNEFSMQSGFQLVRKLQLTRTSPAAPSSTYQINQMFDLDVTNQLGVECWNSYASNYTRPVNIFVTDYLSMTLTNEEGLSFNNVAVLSGTNVNPITTWPGYNANFPAFSFQIPLNTNVASVPVSIYRFNNGSPFLTTNLVLPFETNVNINGSAYPQPNWGMAVTNFIQVVMVDVTSGRIIDYVQLSGPNSVRNVSAEIQNEYDTGNLLGYNGLWVTNQNNPGIPNGIANQLSIALGIYGLGSGANGWNSQDQTTAEDEIDGFRAFYHLAPIYNNPGEAAIIAAAQTNLVMIVPYIPTASTYLHTTWQANDPLVHYLASDLNTSDGSGIDNNYFWPGNLGQLNQRYFPWGGNPKSPGADTNRFNMALKDPQIFSSDNWNFPTNQPLNPNWLGQVHRGTPWQTVYLKSSGVNANNWSVWTGDFNLFDATNMAPVQDWHLAALLASLFNTNNLASELSVNDANPNDWQGSLNGLIAVTNIPDQFDSVLISSNSSQASAIANAVQSERAVQPGQFFGDIGGILATPQLTEQSPFLTPYFNSSLTNIIGDAAYEMIPSQLLSLLRTDSIGSATLMKGGPLGQFTGYDGHAYAIQTSPDLVNWVNISTNYPVNGVFNFTNSSVLNANQQFYRSVILN